MLVVGMPYAPGMVSGSPRQPLKLSFQYWLSDVWKLVMIVGIWTDSPTVAVAPFSSRSSPSPPAWTVHLVPAVFGSRTE